MKVFKPDTMALQYRYWTFSGQHRLSIGLLAMFPLDDSQLSALRTEQELWQSMPAVLGVNAVLDEGLPKVGAEFLLYGSAMAPAGQTTGEMRVEVCIGSLQKSLLVRGDRHIDRLGRISSPEPFGQMPITPQTAWGGPDCEDNPLGRGAEAVQGVDGQMFWPLPNIEHPQQLMLAQGEHVLPAGFWGVTSDHPWRRRHLGQFDGRWQKNRWPALPDDTHHDFFFSAPADQRLPEGFWIGNESLSLRGFDANSVVINSHLPGLRARCFVNCRQPDGSTQLVALTPRAETVWLLPEVQAGLILYRTQVVTADEHGKDICHLYAEWEELRTAPAADTVWQQRFMQLLQPVAAKPLAAITPAEPVTENSRPVTPLAVPVAEPVLPATPAVPSPEIAGIEALTASLQAQIRTLMAKHGLTEADLAKYLPQKEMPRAAAAGSAEDAIASIGDLTRQLEQQTRRIMQQRGLTDADLARHMPTGPIGAPVQSMAEFKSQMIAAFQHVEQQVQTAGLTPGKIKSLLAAREVTNLPETLFPLDLAVFTAALAAWPDEAPVAPAVVEDRTPEPVLPAAAPVEQPMRREDVIQRHAAGEPLQGLDLSDLDLSGLDLAGADFSDCLLENTRFTACQLAGARFDRSLCQGADFSQANLRGASLRACSGGASHWRQAQLTGADLQQTDLTGADLSGANLSQADLRSTQFARAQMNTVQAQGCVASQALFAEAVLTQAVFRQADLQEANFADSQLHQADFSQANANQANFFQAKAPSAVFRETQLEGARAGAGTDFSAADFTDANLRRANFAEVRLEQARLLRTWLDDADFSQVSARGACFYQASARKTRFVAADLSQVDMTVINLFKGSLRQANLQDSLLHGANLYAVDLVGATVQRNSLEGANLDQTVLADH